MNYNFKQIYDRKMRYTRAWEKIENYDGGCMLTRAHIKKLLKKVSAPFYGFERPTIEEITILVDAPLRFKESDNLEAYFDDEDIEQYYNIERTSQGRRYYLLKPEYIGQQFKIRLHTVRYWYSVHALENKLEREIIAADDYLQEYKEWAEEKVDALNKQVKALRANLKKCGSNA